MQRILHLIVRDRTSLTGRLLRAILGSAGIRMLGMGFTFLVGVQLARYLGVHGVGIYGTVMAVTALLVVPAQLGLPQLVTREVSTSVAKQEAAATKTILVWYPVLVAGASFLVVIASSAALSSWPGLDPALRSAGYWGIAAVPLLALLNLAIGALRGLHRVVAAQAFDALIRPVVCAAVLALVAVAWGPLSAASALAVQVLAVLAALVTCVWHVLRSTPPDCVLVKPNRLGRGLTRGSAPMLGTELLRVLDGQYAILLLGFVATLSDAGLFRVAVAVAGFVGLPSTLINLVIMSFVAQLHAEGDRTRLQLIATGSAVVMSALMAAIFCALLLWGEPFIARVFGNSFVPAWAPLMIMAAAYGINAFFGSAATILNMAGEERTVMLVHFVGPAIGITLSLVLFRRFGILAPAIAMAVAECVKGGWMAWAARRSLGVDVTVLSAGLLLHRAAGSGAAISR